MAKLIITENAKLVVEVLKDQRCLFCHEVVKVVYVSAKDEGRDYSRAAICKDCARQVYESKK